MKVLVTGATGFLGRYIIKELEENNYHIIALGRNASVGKELNSQKTRFVEADFTDLASLRKVFTDDIDFVVHAGALSDVWGNPDDFYRHNVLGTKHMISLSQAVNIKRFVYISSPSIYAKAEDQIAISEYLPDDNHLTPYIWSKLEAEKLCHQTKTIEFVILRPRALIGIGDTSIIPRLLKMSQRIGLPLIKKGENLVDLTCVENVAYAVRLAMESDKASGRTYNITNGEPMRFREVMDLFLSEMGIEIRYLTIPSWLLGLAASGIELVHRLFKIYKEPLFTRYTFYLLRYSQTLSIDKAKRDLGYTAKISVREGIKKYAKEYRECGLL